MSYFAGVSQSFPPVALASHPKREIFNLSHKYYESLGGNILQYIRHLKCEKWAVFVFVCSWETQPNGISATFAGGRGSSFQWHVSFPSPKMEPVSLWGQRCQSPLFGRVTAAWVQNDIDTWVRICPISVLGARGRLSYHLYRPIPKRIVSD